MFLTYIQTECIRKQRGITSAWLQITDLFGPVKQGPEWQHTARSGKRNINPPEMQNLDLWYKKPTLSIVLYHAIFLN